MDYIDLLKDQCPPAIVQYVTSSDMVEAYKEPWPNRDFAGQNISESCHIAALLYRSSILPANTSDTIADYIVRDAIQYFAKIPTENRPVLASAVQQLAAGERLPQSFFSFVTQHRIDVRETLLRHFPTLPISEAATPEKNPKSFAYLRYLTAMGDADALANLIEALRLEPNPANVNNQLGQIWMFRMPQADMVFEAFINDTRQSLSPYRTPGIVVANNVRRYLGLPKHEGPYRLLEPNGLPFHLEPGAPIPEWGDR